MKKIIVLLMLVFIGASTTIYAQESKSESRRAERKAQRDAEKAREKIEEERAYTDAVQAIKERKFVLEADRVTFKRGRSAFVTSNTNFILLMVTGHPYRLLLMAPLQVLMELEVLQWMAL